MSDSRPPSASSRHLSNSCACASEAAAICASSSLRELSAPATSSPARNFAARRRSWTASSDSRNSASASREAANSASAVATLSSAASCASWRHRATSAARSSAAATARLSASAAASSVRARRNSRSRHWLRSWTPTSSASASAPAEASVSSMAPSIFRRISRIAFAADASASSRHRANSSPCCNTVRSRRRSASSRSRCSCSRASAAFASSAARRSPRTVCEARSSASTCWASRRRWSISCAAFFESSASSMYSLALRSASFAASARCKASLAKRSSAEPTARLQISISSRNEATTMFSKSPHMTCNSSELHTSTTSLFTLASTSTFIAREANSNVERVSAACSAAGLKQTNNDVLQLPPMEPSKIRVSLLSRKGTCVLLAARALTTLPKTSKLLLMARASFN
mmetsp:Transcript_84478/g.244209  ORF Transcript_84478/g.244209 Transcript_84478/m.244209 type:complete len:403 (-) Transcript_84478:829-2037(-)